ncbi:unnamed protein product [Prorocentrum cordatum]|uniref:Peptidase S54 rhomboid domain-containing protein n=1 Tax=Prorocentrum cordatum TaxID=2364126 RepID=A0ABN9RA34_9DINO|nr:unnamed protein product [Polarella glacialis]
MAMAGGGGAARLEARSRQLAARRVGAAGVLLAALLAGGGRLWSPQSPALAAEVTLETMGTEPPSLADAGRSRTPTGSILGALVRPCAVSGATCHCVGTLIFSTALGDAVREVNSDGEMQCSAEALGAPGHYDMRICWCQDGIPWDDEVRKGLAAIVRQGLTPRIDIAADEDPGLTEDGCSAQSDGLWYGCVVMSRRWDTSVIPQALVRAAPPEEQLDMTLKKLDACHRLAPDASLRVLGVRSGESADAVAVPARIASTCSVVWRPGDGVMWTAEPVALYCATSPGSCTTTPCECKRAADRKLELHTAQGRRCWACAEAGQEHNFRVSALAEKVKGTSMSWWPPYGINCPPILWMFMDWKMVMSDCPVVFGYMVVFVGCLLLRRAEEFTGGAIPWTRVAPVFGPALKRGEVWRFFTFTFFHLQFLDLFHNMLTLFDALDVEGTPAIVLGDGSNLKCGVGAKQNFMCYPSIGMGSYHTLCVAIISAAVGSMTFTWFNFKGVTTGASALGFGLSGAIVALYGLYAGAELDQTTTVQRSFQDWVYLRLIFVAFHIAMEFIRGLSQKDAAGLFAHAAAFASGFAYVLYFLPPMGDGTLLPSDRPYIVPCAYDIHGEDASYATDAVPECIRLFSQVYEYTVPDARAKALRMFTGVVAMTVANMFFLTGARVSSSEAVLVAGQEVSAVCCTRRKQGGQSPAGGSNIEGRSLVLWCSVEGATNLPAPAADAGAWYVELRCLDADPRGDVGALLERTPLASARTRNESGSQTVQWEEPLFLPVKFSKKGHIQVVLRRAPGGAALGHAAITMPQVLRFNKRDHRDEKMKLQALGEGTTASLCM